MKIHKKVEGRDFSADLVRIRDDNQCQLCGRYWDNSSRRLDTHHILEKEQSKKGYYSKDERKRIITLCHRCHLNLPISRFAFSNGNNGGSSMLLDKVKVDKLNKLFEEYFYFCIEINSMTEDDKIEKEREKRRNKRKEHLEKLMSDTRRLEMKKMREEGYTLKAIGEKFGLSHERVRQLLVVFQETI